MLEPLFCPKSIALVGAAHTEEKLGGVILKNLLQSVAGRSGRLYPVNPNREELMGIRSYRNDSDIPEPVDMLIIIRPAPEVPGILRRFCGRARCAILVSAGFAETGEAALQEEVRLACRQTGIRLLGPNCMGVVNPAEQLDTLFLPTSRLVRPKRGNLSVTTQSGAILSAIFEGLASANTGISKAAHYGNAIDIDESDLYEYFLEDDETEVVISYIESVADGRRFVEKASLLAAKKPLLVLKAGKSAGGQAAAFSHTGRLAGSYKIFRSVMKEFDIAEARDFEDLLDGAKALSYQRGRARGNRVLVITNGGGEGVLAADECMRQGLELSPLPEDKRIILKKIFPPFYVVGNPFDVTAQTNDDYFIKVLETFEADYDGFFVVALTNVFAVTERLGHFLCRFRQRLKKPVVFLTGADSLGRRLTEIVEGAGIPAYPTPERAMRALRRMLSHEG